ncbi:MAG: hypothetical protein SGILL_007651, partial [Bacillariaceae sp.]
KRFDGMDSHLRQQRRGGEMLRSLQVAPSCDLQHASDVTSALEPFTENARDCSIRLSEVKDDVGTAKDVAKKAHQFALTSSRLAGTLGSMYRRNKSLAPLIKLIPKVGGIMNKISEGLHTVEKVLNKIGDKEPPLRKLKDKLQQAEKTIQGLEVATEASAVFGQEVQDVVNKAMEDSTNNQCFGSDAIDNVAAFVPTSDIDQASKLYQLCATTTGLPEIDGAFPEFGFLNDLTEVVSNIFEWQEKIVGKVVNASDYAACCYPAVIFLADIAEIFTDTFDLALCWLDPAIDQGVENAIDHGLDILLPAFSPLVSRYNEKVNTMNSFINSLNWIINGTEVPVISAQPQIELDSATGSFSATGDILTLSDTRNPSASLPTFSEIDFGDQGSFELLDLFGEPLNLARLATEIADGCSEAAGALVTMDEYECCGIARESRNIPVEGWGVGDSCGVKPDCASYSCVGGYCADGSLGSTCNLLLNNCDSDLYCAGALPAKCAAKLVDGSPCGSHPTCQSNACIGLECSSGNNGDTCDLLNSQWCKSGECRGAFPARCAECSPPSNAGCTSSEYCHLGQCTPKLSIGSLCVEERVCGSGFCDGKCVECYGSGNVGCSSAEYCHLGQCIGKLDNGSWCVEERVCKSGHCDGKCVECYGSGNAGCSSSEYCHLGQCLGKLDNGAWCVEARVCKSGRCVFPGKCRS